MDTLTDFVDSGVIPIVLLILRLVVPVLALYVVWRSYTSYKKSLRRKDPVIMLVNHEARMKFPVLYWENSIGRDRSNDIVLPDPAISRDHAVLLRREEGWMVCDTESHSGVFVNGQKADRTVVNVGDEILLGNTSLMLMRREDAGIPTSRKIFRGFSQNAASPSKLMVVTSLTLLLMTLQLCFATREFTAAPFLYFGGLMAVGWGLFIYSMLVLRRVSFEMETMGFLLSGIGVLLLAAFDGQDGSNMARTQLVAMILGILIFCFLIWFMEDLERVEKFRRHIGIGALALLALTFLIGTNVNGAKNWIQIGGLSLQPSELVKIAFILFGAASLDRLQTKRNMGEFLIFTALCMGMLFLMKDFGTALIFFATFMIIAFMRSGSIRTIALILATIVFGVMLILFFLPSIADHVVSRFSGWGHIWEDVSGVGFQQTQMLTYLASGGLAGVGLGKGYFYSIFGAENDAVFGLLCEEQGLLLGLVVLFALILLISYSRSDVTRSRSTFYSIVSCAAAGLMLFQAMLNVLGSTDILPFTGVTLPFISAGGTSMMSVWGMMAFLKASDERTYAARRVSKKQKQAQLLQQEQEAAMRRRAAMQRQWETGQPQDGYFR